MMELEDERLDSATIVDILNEDCWRIILDLIDIEDIIRSERVSKQWQSVILRYLQGVSFRIVGHCYCQDAHKFRVLTLKQEDDAHELDQITTKFGLNVKKSVCHNKACLEILSRNCPNLEHIAFVQIRDDALSNGGQTNFTKLRTVHIDVYKKITDECLSTWLGELAIEEVYIERADILTGSFLKQLTNLRILSVRQCPAFKFQNLLSPDLTRLKKLELIDLPEEIFRDLHLLSDKLPKLEDLCLKRAKPFGRELAEFVSRLELERLDLSYNELLNDEWLEIIARGCGRLRELDLEYCLGVTERGILAVCRAAAPSLRTLRLGSNNEMCNYHVEAYVTACPNLTLLDVTYGMGLSENLVDVVGELTRGRPRLRLMVANTMIEGFHADRYPWLILDFSDESYYEDYEDFRSDSPSDRPL